MYKEIPYEIYNNLKPRDRGHDIGLTASMTWGRGGAGILVVTHDLSEILLLHRSNYVLDPGLWGIAGGARKETATGMEEAIITACCESKEEMGSLPEGVMLIPPYVYNKPRTDFTYETFIIKVDPEVRQTYVPILNWENQNSGWFNRVNPGDIRIHPGVKAVLNNYELFLGH